MSIDASTALRRLARSARGYGPGHADGKLAALHVLERRRLRTARQVLDFHEILCFLRAYPDDPRVLSQVERTLRGFDRRADLRRNREALTDSGIAGTAITYRLFWPAARWAARRWPGRLHLEWDDDEAATAIRRTLPLLVSAAEAETLRQDRWTAAECIERLRGGDETDATFFVRRLQALPGNDFTREAVHDGIDAGYRIVPGPAGPSRTRAHHPGSGVVYQERPPTRDRPDLQREIARAPRATRHVSPREGRRLIELSREAMLTRSRDLEAFSFGNPRDVRLVDDGDGLQFAVIGVVPERRRLLHAIYGYLSLRNGVPIGYVQVDPLLGNAGISYNTFETFRGAEAAWVFGRMLAATHHLFGTRAFSIEPYQLGRGNDEGLRSGAWWFYYKLGFRPDSATVRSVVRRELATMRRRPAHRSTRATLERLASAHLFYELPGTRSTLPPPPWDLGWHVARELTARSGSDREAALRDCSRQAAQLLGVRSRAGWSAGERGAWRRFGPLVVALPGVERWSRKDRSALARVIRAKGAPGEGEFLKRVDEHPRLGRALLRLLKKTT